MRGNGSSKEEHQSYYRPNTFCLWTQGRLLILARQKRICTSKNRLDIRKEGRDALLMRLTEWLRCLSKLSCFIQVTVSSVREVFNPLSRQQIYVTNRWLLITSAPWKSNEITCTYASIRLYMVLSAESWITLKKIIRRENFEGMFAKTLCLRVQSSSQPYWVFLLGCWNIKACWECWERLADAPSF